MAVWLGREWSHEPKRVLQLALCIDARVAPHDGQGVRRGIPGLLRNSCSALYAFCAQVRRSQDLAFECSGPLRRHWERTLLRCYDVTGNYLASLLFAEAVQVGA
jgi:hypothetical protein